MKPCETCIHFKPPGIFRSARCKRTNRICSIERHQEQLPDELIEVVEDMCGLDGKHWECNIGDR